MSIAADASARTGSLGWWRVLLTGALVGAAAVSVVALLSIAGTDRLGWDFRFTYLRAAERVLHGESPYPPLDDAVIGSGTAYIYPPQLAVLLAPVSWLPHGLLVDVAFVGALAALMGALAVLGVRDARCYAAALVWGSTSAALELLNLTAFLAFALACVWRYRSTLWPLASLLGLAIATKLFLWPLALWALATGRSRAVVRAAIIGVVVTFGSWAIIGFQGLTTYPELLSRFTQVEGEPNSYSIVAVAVAVGAGASVGLVVGIVVGAALLLACVYFGMRAHDSERSFIAALGAALALTPVAWLHFFVLLLVPMGIARPRFSAIWLLPILLWMCPRAGNGNELQTLLPAVVAAVLIGALLSRPAERPLAVPVTS
jgi:glycosyl transferase family 87